MAAVSVGDADAFGRTLNMSHGSADDGISALMDLFVHGWTAVQSDTSGNKPSSFPYIGLRSKLTFTVDYRSGTPNQEYLYPKEYVCSR